MHLLVLFSRSPLHCVILFLSFIRLSNTLLRYRLKLCVADSTSRATFVLLGHAADRIMPISAAELALAYPDAGGPLPHALQMMIGQKGLNLPRAQLLAQLPAPQLPYRTPRSLSTPNILLLFLVPLLFPHFTSRSLISLVIAARHPAMKLPFLRNRPMFHLSQHIVLNLNRQARTLLSRHHHQGNFSVLTKLQQLLSSQQALSKCLPSTNSHLLS
ncbi:hypothetical protein LINGRAHAP2_LOCUS35265 [Linum grandiflorum]